MVFVTIKKWQYINGDNQQSWSDCKTNKQLKCGISTRSFWSKLVAKEAIAPAVSKVYSDWEGSKGKSYYQNVKILDKQEPKKMENTTTLIRPTGLNWCYFLG